VVSIAHLKVCSTGPKEGPVMTYGKYNVIKELKRAAEGKKPAVPVGILLLQVTNGYPAIQSLIKDAFSIEED
jgi:hypothetical protein